MIKSPLLAPRDTPDTAKLHYPVLASPKLDGIRALVIEGMLLSRSMKLIPNRYAQKLFGLPQYHGFDGELIVGAETSPTVFQTTTSGVMTRIGNPDVVYRVFDKFDMPTGYYYRYIELEKVINGMQDPHIQIVKHTLIESPDDLDLYESIQLELGYEGAMVRSLTGEYKQGRATDKEATIFKIKRFKDSEAIVVGFYEQLHNENAKDAYGKRTSHQDGKTPLNTLGGFEVIGMKEPFEGVEFDVGTGRGLTQELRKHIWDNRSKYINKVIKFKYQECGTKDKPRIPIYLGFRDPRDM